jgi:hypothetical protein
LIATEFLAQLGKTRTSFEWKLTSEKAFPGDRRSQPRLLIRGTTEKAGGVQFDPIGAVCYLMTGRTYDENSWLDAAEAIELSPIDAGDLTAAANDRWWTEAGGKRQPDPYLQSLRERLAGAVGLDVNQT